MGVLSGGGDFCFSVPISAVYFPGATACEYTLSGLTDTFFFFNSFL